MKILLATCCLTAFTISSPVFSMDSKKTEYVKSAFSFSDKKQWINAFSYIDDSNDNALKSLIEWRYLLAYDSGASFFEIRNFIKLHPDWPEQKRLRIRAEMSLSDSNVSYGEIIAWFADNPPITGVGKIALVNAFEKSNIKISNKEKKSLILEAWVDGDFTKSQEKSILKSFGKFISKKDNIARTDRLVWEGKTKSAKRMFKLVGSSHRKLYKARIALQANKRGVSRLISSLPSSVKNDIGLIYDRMRFRSKRNDDKGVRKLLLSTPNKVPYPKKWWKYRGAKIREAMLEGKTSLATRLLANHGQERDKYSQGLADANWLKGRLLLEYSKNPQDAYRVFYNMFSEVKSPISKSRAAYWAAKSAKEAGNIRDANSWFEIASTYPTTFYGQLASIFYHGNAPLNIPKQPIIDDDIRKEFDSRSIVRAAKLCIYANQIRLAGKIINHLVTNSSNSSEALLASELGVKAGKSYLSVRGAKKALQNNIILINAGYPTPITPENLELPRELTLSITRQESEFNDAAKSRAGALGLMQLLPSTAREMARKNGISYRKKKLYEAEYNMILGSIYLQRMIDSYDGSIVMAIAAYNGGPGNVRKWIKKFGRPDNNIDSVVNWIENIPFSETRNYVQRVLENLQIYRHIKAQKNRASTKLLLGEDLLK